MSSIDTSFVSSRATLRQRMARMLEPSFERRFRQRAVRAAQLRALSDAELSLLGLSREDILLEVFSGRH